MSICIGGMDQWVKSTLVYGRPVLEGDSCMKKLSTRFTNLFKYQDTETLHGSEKLIAKFSNLHAMMFNPFVAAEMIKKNYGLAKVPEGHRVSSVEEIKDFYRHGGKGLRFD